MDVNIDDDDTEEFFRNLFAQLESLSLSEATETTDQWNINPLLQPLPSQFQEQAPPPLPQQAPSYATAGVSQNLGQLMGPEYHPDTVYTQDQSVVKIGSNKRIIAVDPTQQLDQCYINAETSQSINPTLQTGRSPSQALFTVPPESIQFKPVGSSVDTRAAQQQPRKRQRR